MILKKVDSRVVSELKHLRIKTISVPTNKATKRELNQSYYVDENDISRLFFLTQGQHMHCLLSNVIF